MTTTVIRGGRVIDPGVGRDEIADLWMVDGVFAEPVSGSVDRELNAAVSYTHLTLPTILLV